MSFAKTCSSVLAAAAGSCSPLSEKKVVKEILEHLGLPSTGPPVAPTRITAASEETPWQDDVPAAANAALTGSPMPIS